MSRNILRAQPPAVPPRQVAFSFTDLTQKAEAYLATVQTQAQAIIADAHQQAQAIRQRAEQEGKAAALAEVERMAAEQVGQQMKTLLPALREALRQIQDARHAWQKHWEAQAVHLAAGMAARVIRRELQRHPEVTLTLLREALELAAGSAEVRIFLNSDDHRTLGRQARMLVDEINHIGAAELIPSPDVTPGGCRIETKFGVIDQQIEAQLARIEEELTD
jgi:flagellar assembly protein FliH